MNRLWYKEPAKNWEEALPIGNGKLGAMIYGGVKEEVLQLNEDSIWYGAPIDRNNPDTQMKLEEVRGLLLEGKISEAERLMTYAFSGIPESQRMYQTLGEMKLNFLNKQDTVAYERELNIQEALHKVSYRLCTEDCTLERETFTTAVDHVIAMKLTSGSNNLDFDVALRRGRYLNRAYRYSKDSIVMDGNLGEGGNSFAVMVRALAKEGTVEVLGEHLLVRGAKEVTLYLTATTTFNLFGIGKSKELDNLPSILAEEAAKVIDAAVVYGYETLKERHKKDFIELFERVKLELDNDEELDKLPTNERLARIDEEHPDHGLLMLYYQFGRYLMISGSRKGGLPLNLQGIWCKDFLSAWDSKYTININTEMNYWPAETCNLSECHEPLFDLIKRMVANGRITAEKMYGCRGFVAHHNTDLYEIIENSRLSHLSKPK